jgi:hypothetical protein
MYIYLSIETTDTAPDEISKIIGIGPTKTANIGDPISKTKIKHKKNRWEYRIEGNMPFELEPLVIQLFNNFPDKSALRTAISHGIGTVVCVFHSPDRTPCIELTANTVKLISDFNCGFWLDYYQYA